MKRNWLVRHQELPPPSDLQREQLVETLSKLKDHTVFAYVLSTLRLEATDPIQPRIFGQVGSGPNLEGGAVTLTTCKHYMRSTGTFSRALGRGGVLVAGFCSSTITPDQQNALFYLGRVERTFETHSDLAEALPAETRRAKAVTGNYLGDLFEPSNQTTALRDFEGTSYLLPKTGHSHFDQMRHPGSTLDSLQADLNAPDRRRAQLLLFDPLKTWTWRLPLIFWNAEGAGRGLGRGHRRMAVSEFVKSIE